MPPDTPETTQGQPEAANARQRAHDALDRAFMTRTVRGEDVTGVNLSRFTDALRELDVPIEVRRRDRIEPDPSAEAAAKTLGGATPSVPAVTVVLSGARFEVEWHPEDELAALIQRAISAAGVQPPAEGQPWRWWQLRTEEGTLLDPAAVCGHDFDGAATLFLDPYAGGGADRPYDRVGNLESASTGNAHPPGLRLSERELWDRTEDKTVRDVLSRLSRERKDAAEARDELDLLGVPCAINDNLLELRARIGMLGLRAVPSRAEQPTVNDGPAESENPNVWAARRVARTVDTLAATVGGALRELLDRTATLDVKEDPLHVEESTDDEWPFDDDPPDPL